VAARAKCEADPEEFLAADAGQLAELMTTLLAPVDAAVFTGELAEHLVACTRDGLGPGADGWWDDCVAEFEPWDFDFDAIAMPVLLRHGRQDRFVPFTHGEWLARRIPGWSPS
jgi:pimeloyl-ACP methyl ester carboxylesterase